jgi:hypothetical protein
MMLGIFLHRKISTEREEELRKERLEWIEGRFLAATAFGRELESWPSPIEVFEAIMLGGPDPWLKLWKQFTGKYPAWSPYQALSPEQESKRREAQSLKETDPERLLMADKQKKRVR